MAEALASLKEGLRDTADPLYDSWKLRPRPSANPAGEGRPPQVSPRVVPPAPSPVTEIEIDITLEGTPDQTPAVPSGPSTASEGDETRDALVEDAFFNGPGRVESTEASIEMTPEPPSRLSVQADTVRVRVIRYQSFPQWAVVLAAALLVFAASLFAVRLSLPLAAARAVRSLWGNETALENEAVAVAPPVPSSPSPAPDPATSAAAHFTAPVVSAAGAGAPSFREQPGAESEFEDPPTADPAALAVPPPSPAAKIPNAPSRRRRGARDFFRDPGF
jgi:hypothetical protein